MQAGGVTVILTSCGRFDLLRITLESFFKFNTYDIAEFIIYEDSCLPIPQDLKDEYPFIRFLKGWGRYGQIFALDALWSEVKTEYAFTCEDDWEFIREGFIEDSMEVLKLEPTVLQCWLTSLEPNNTHPINWVNDKYGILTNSGGVWSGTRFNPALKRKADYDLIAPFSQHTTWNAEKPWKCEADISKVYHKLWFRGAILPNIYMRHIGEGRHVT